MADSDKTPALHGSCHCGFIKYTVTPPASFLTAPTASRCNCSVCQRSAFTTLSVSPTAFTLLSPASKDELPDYQSTHKTIHLYFCDKCGVQVVREGSYEFSGKTQDFFNVNLLTIHQPQPEGGIDFDLSSIKIKYWDGLHDNWAGGEASEPWSGGCI